MKERKKRVNKLIRNRETIERIIKNEDKKGRKKDQKGRQKKNKDRKEERPKKGSK